MAKPSPQQPSDAWATKTAGLPPVESPFPNHKGAQGAPGRDCLGTITWARTVTLVHCQVERKSPGSLTASCRSHSRGVGTCSSHLSPPPTTTPLPELSNKHAVVCCTQACATPRPRVGRPVGSSAVLRWLQMQGRSKIISIQYGMQGTYIQVHRLWAGLMSLTLRGHSDCCPCLLLLLEGVTRKPNGPEAESWRFGVNPTKF